MEPTTVSYYGAPSLFSLLCATFDLVSEHLTLATKFSTHPETVKLLTYVIEGVVYKIFETLEYKGKRDPRLHLGISDSSLKQLRGALRDMTLNVKTLSCSMSSLLDTNIHPALLTSHEIETVINQMEKILGDVAEIKRRFELDIYLTFHKKTPMKICDFALNGTCLHGLKCKFPHSEEKLQFLIKASQSKCRMFYKLGFCSYGYRCKFSHTIPDQQNENENGESLAVENKTKPETIYLFDEEKPQNDLN